MESSGQQSVVSEIKRNNTLKIFDPDEYAVDSPISLLLLNTAS
jgi:hypothetical protein